MLANKRESGILLHITSLPNEQGIGTLGHEAKEFVDFLVNCGQNIWQICPLGPTGYGDSPYQTFSAFAGNPLLLDMVNLVEKGLLKSKDLEILRHYPREKVDFGEIYRTKNRLLKKAFLGFKKDDTYQKFCDENDYWLHDYALFMAIKDKFGGKAWSDWPRELKLKVALQLEQLGTSLLESIEYYKFLQFVFMQQWTKLHSYASGKGVKIFGDIPIFVAFDSADAWSNRHLFHFDENANPTVVSGVPPDYFSSTGQLWGNPLYNWQKMKETNFFWWRKRFEHSLKMYDLIRVDHFRGFAGYWAVPAGEKTAVHGSWQPAPGNELFSALTETFGNLPVIAEDLGVITEDVIALKNKFGYPGMKILQFGFGSGNDNPYLPHNYPTNCVAYTGTHDNDTTWGWFIKLPEDEKRQICAYLGCKENEICHAMIKAIWQSKARIAIAPMQDWLELGSEARMNTPGKASGNWQWRVRKERLDHILSAKIRELTSHCER